jgi:hypothetical protein
MISEALIKSLMFGVLLLGFLLSERLLKIRLAEGSCQLLLPFVTNKAVKVLKYVVHAIISSFFYCMIAQMTLFTLDPINTWHLGYFFTMSITIKIFDIRAN